MTKKILIWKMTLCELMLKLRDKCEEEDAMATVEYAIMIVAVSGFAGLMVLLLKSDWAKDMLQGIIEGAVDGA